MYSGDDLPKGGLPHSDIHGSTIARISPRLFAACHVLHRLLVPRHPPNALVSLTIQTPITPARSTKPRNKLLQCSRQQALRSLSLYTSIPRFTCQRSTLARTSLSRGGSLGSGHSWGPEVPAEASRCPDRPEAVLAGHRERRAEPDDLAGSHCFRKVATRGTSAPQRHALSLKGGDPAAGSPTATLLRLHPSH